jgi:hypothetical protein
MEELHAVVLKKIRRRIAVEIKNHFTIAPKYCWIFYLLLGIS